MSERLGWPTLTGRGGLPEDWMGVHGSILHCIPSSSLLIQSVGTSPAPDCKPGLSQFFRFRLKPILLIL